MPDVIGNIFTAVLTSGIVTALIKMLFARSLNDLQKQLSAYTIRYSKLHELRVNAFAEAYSLLMKLQDSVARYIAVTSPARVHSNDDYNKARNALSEADMKFKDYYESCIIFLPDGARDRMDEMHTTLRQIPLLFENRAESNQIIRGHGEALDAFKNRIPPIRDNLIEEFGKLVEGK